MPNSTETENTMICKENACADVSHDFKHHVSERVKFYEGNIKESPSPSHKKLKANSNSVLVVPIGILFVLASLYLAASAFQSNFANNKDQKDHVIQDENLLKQKEQPQGQEAVERIKILEKLLEYKDLCTELEIFTKDLRLLNELIKKKDLSKYYLPGIVEVGEDRRCIVDHEERTESSSHTVNKAYPRNKLSHRNVQRRINKATSMKNNKIKNDNSKNFSDGNNKKSDQTTSKKSNTAEPIIYLFALVFIYLLLKAASDINQHYKLQNKGDKRLRRCSLQSYAQIHKQDRRASKGSPKRKHNNKVLMNIRSKSVDRSNETIVKKSKILGDLRKYISLDEPNRLLNMPYGVQSSIQSPVICNTINKLNTMALWKN
ncbi:uncharacterized protein [Eurosta solidaginis]|uniref:uncharacterized protein isoform X2 n=1 Tax=Eurosta solidaginis TaxID=178769 RepID=UPI003530C703